jgi:hypothetical protein
MVPARLVGVFQPPPTDCTDASLNPLIIELSSRPTVTAMSTAAASVRVKIWSASQATHRDGSHVVGPAPGNPGQPHQLHQPRAGQIGDLPSTASSCRAAESPRLGRYRTYAQNGTDIAAKPRNNSNVEEQSDAAASRSTTGRPNWPDWSELSDRAVHCPAGQFTEDARALLDHDPDRSFGVVHATFGRPKGKGFDEEAARQVRGRARSDDRSGVDRGDLAGRRHGEDGVGWSLLWRP